MQAVRVLIADDHELFAETLGLALEFEDRIEVVGSARNGKEAVRQSLDSRPDALEFASDGPCVLSFVRHTLSKTTLLHPIAQS